MSGLAAHGELLYLDSLLDTLDLRDEYPPGEGAIETDTEHTMMINDAVHSTTMRAFEIPLGGFLLDGDQCLIAFLPISCLQMVTRRCWVPVGLDHHLLLVDY